MSKLSIQELWERYSPIWKKRMKRFSTIESYWKNHILPLLGAHTDESLTKQTLESWLVSLPVSPVTANQILTQLGKLWREAQDDSESGWDPDRKPVLTKIKKLRTGKRKKTTLTLHQAAGLLEAGILSDDWRPAFALALYFSPRKGEILASKIEHWDLERHLGSIPERKNGIPLEDFPFPDELAPFLRLAIERAESVGSEYLFPAPGGGKRPENTEASQILRSALARIGVVEGWQHQCQTPGCGWSENRKTAAETKCPQCKRLLKPRAIPKKIRFHDLRVTSISLHTEAHCHPRVIEAMAGHAPRDMEGKRYVQLSTDFCRQEVNKLSLKVSAQLNKKAEFLNSGSAQPHAASPCGRRAVANQTELITGHQLSAPLLTTPQAATLLGVSVSTFNRRFRSWGLAPVRLGVNKRFVRSDIDALIARLRDK